MYTKISEWDTNHFGLNIAKLSYTENPPDIGKGIQEARLQGTKLLINRCPTDAFNWIHTLESNGFLLMDTIVYYSIDLASYQIPEPKYVARAAIDNDIPIVRRMARESFRGYISHYYADYNLNKAKCDEVYELWAVNSFCDKSLADYVQITEIDGKPAMFVTIRLKQYGKVGEIILGSADPNMRGKGVYSDSIIHGIKWIDKQGCEKMEISTQITTLNVQRSWARLGLGINRSYYTFHLWV
jgi:hypothetical protein